MTKKTKRIPEAAMTFRLAENAEIELVDKVEEGGGAEARFRIQALSGKPIMGHWFWGNLAIELTGIQGKNRVPVLVDHDVSMRVGVSDQREIDPKHGLMMHGKFLANSALAAQVRNESKDGFPWEASVRLMPTKIERVGDGVEAEVNGQKFRGPGHIFRRSQLREVSFTALGADSNTSAAALSDRSEEVTAEFTNLNEGTMDEEEKNGGAQLQQPPAATAPNADQIREEAKLSERNRVAGIRAAATPEQHQLVDELIVGGAELSAAQARLAEDLRAKFRVMMNSQANHEGSRSAGNRRDDTSTKLAEINAMPDGRDKWASQYEHDAKLREEYLSKDSYVALRAAEQAGWNPRRIPRLLKADGTPLAMQPWEEVALSASSPSGLVTISGITAGYAMALANALGMSWARELASAFSTNSPSETYPWLRAAPTLRKWEGERSVREIRGDQIVLWNEEYEATIEFKVADLRRDKTGQIMARASDLATRVAYFPESLLTSLLTANGNGYDAAAFFATNHAVGSSGTINNALATGDGLAGGAAPSTAQMSANILTVMSAMMAYLDDQGQPLNEGARQFLIMTPAKLFGPTVAAINAMFTSASASNPLGELARYGFSFKPVLNARLTTQNQFYMFRTDAGIRSLLMQEEGVNPMQLGPESEHAKKTNRVQFGHGWQGAVGYGRFELAARGTTS